MIEARKLKAVRRMQFIIWNISALFHINYKRLRGFNCYFIMQYFVLIIYLFIYFYLWSNAKIGQENAAPRDLKGRISIRKKQSDERVGEKALSTPVWNIYYCKSGKGGDQKKVPVPWSHGNYTIGEWSGSPVFQFNNQGVLGVGESRAKPKI